MILLLTVFTVSAQLEWKGKIDSAEMLVDSLRFDEAINILQTLVTDAVSTSSDSVQALALIKLGTAFAKANKDSLSTKYYQDAYEISRINGYEQLEASSLFGLGASHQRLRKYRLAENFYRESVDIFLVYGDTLLVSYIYSNLALMHSQNGDIEKEIQYSLLSISMQQQLKDEYGLGVSYSNLALAEYNRGNFENSVKYYRKSQDYFDRDENTSDFSNSILNLAKTYHKIGVFDSSSYFFNFYDSIGHDIYHKGYEDKILELETKFKTSEIERENAVKQVQIEAQQRNLIILGSLVFLALVIIVAIYLYNEQRKKNMRALAARDQTLKDQRIEELLNQQELKTTYALLEGQDKERTRIAQDLHDNISTTMVTMTMFLDSLKPKSLTAEEAKLLKRVDEIAHQVTEDTRKLSHSLDSGSLKHFGLEVAINDLLEAVEKSGTATKGSSSVDMQSVLPSELSINIYRVLQELINNTLKHANADHFAIEITEIKDEYLTIIYEDDGAGFDPAANKSGIGIKNIHSRIDSMNATLTIDSKKGRRTTFIIEIPFKL